ncbi:MAG TPA: VWA domain-containing protein [Terriglobales bacterium]|jgi:Ca-activated chloride channel homolog|nr:VWA domain-containing protein [Terriglobales bacterium]
MRLRSSRLFLAAVLFLVLPSLVAQDSAQQPPSSTANSSQQTPDATKSSPAAQQPNAPPSTSPSQEPVQPPRTSTPPAGQQGASPSPANPNGSTQSGDTQQQPESSDSGVFVFRKDVDEVVLHAVVIDDKQHMVTDLDRNAFAVYEDGKLQKITSFRHEDIPVAMGIVIDNSGSMREKRQKVNQASLNLVRSSNPQDEVFIVNFSDEYYLDQSFTSDIKKLREALEKIDARGGTALYDAVVASADELKKNGRLDRKVLLVVTDGEDNESRESLEQAVRRLQEENGPTVYAIGLLGEEKQRRARRALQTMSERTGGIAFLPKNLDEVDNISKTIAHDIRSVYTIGYRPTNPRSAGGYRTIRVEAKAKGYGKLNVRTKSGYYAGASRSSAGGQ